MVGSDARAALWRELPAARVAAAKQLPDDALSALTREFLEGCPSDAWPYGCSTSINPWILFLGPSPGASPAAGDADYKLRPSYSPTAGSPPTSMTYVDSRGFCDRLRSLTVAVVRADDGPDVGTEDALALAGLMNLDPGASGQAKNVEVDPAFGRWALEVSFRRLRPRYIVGVGLGDFLRDASRRWLRDALGSYVGMSFHPDRAPISVPFRGYKLKNYKFRVWPSSNADLGAQHLILFPQHPSRAPMTNANTWGAAVREFVDLTRAL